jgi:glutaredoxin-dependent peroxiredoxin
LNLDHRTLLTWTCWAPDSWRQPKMLTERRENEQDAQRRMLNAESPGMIRRSVASKGDDMSVDVGSKGPDFTLMNQDRQPVTLSQQRGKPVVLAFFPAAFSSVCQKELCTFRDSMAQLNKAQAEVFGISVDTFFALKAFQDQQHLNFQLLSDFNKQVIRDYGAFNEDMIGLKGIAKRAVFVLDKDGVVRYREVLDDARNEPNYQKVLDTVASFG